MQQEAISGPRNDRGSGVANGESMTEGEKLQQRKLIATIDWTGAMEYKSR